MSDKITDPNSFTPDKGTFQNDLENLINCHSLEGGSDTPDFILARYLRGCLDNFDLVLRQREEWYGRTGTPVETGCPPPNIEVSHE